jgi:hypothetical protein
MEYAANGTLKLATAATPLSEVTTAWAQGDKNGKRVVILP